LLLKPKHQDHGKVAIMKRHLSVFLLLSALLVAGCKSEMPNTTSEKQREEQTIKTYLTGKRVLITYREGSPVYGTYFFFYTHFCMSGQYMIFAQSRKQTVLGNEQVYNWEEYGTWDVISVQTQATLQFRSTSGELGSYPIRLLSDGGIWIGDGISVTQQGEAQCR
jgi:hypothetical protein